MNLENRSLSNNKGKTEISGYLVLICFLVVPLACAIGIGWLGYPNPWLYIPGVFVGAFIGVLMGVIIFVSSKPGCAGDKTKNEEYEEEKREEGRSIGTEISIAQSKEDVDTSNNDPQEFDCRCSVCGKTGYVQQIPNVPVSDCFCDEHSPDDVFYPYTYVLPLFVLGLLIAIGWLIYRWFF